MLRKLGKNQKVIRCYETFQLNQTKTMCVWKIEWKKRHSKPENADCWPDFDALLRIHISMVLSDSCCKKFIDVLSFRHNKKLKLTGIVSLKRINKQKVCALENRETRADCSLKNFGDFQTKIHISGAWLWTKIIHE